jgi:hypothetical protein
LVYIQQLVSMSAPDWHRRQPIGRANVECTRALSDFAGGNRILSENRDEIARSKLRSMSLSRTSYQTVEKFRVDIPPLLKRRMN